ncbi:MAG: biotin--[acetyl-CoA-carboxylase] ligase [Candidatus Marinimicrobia bacterium]|nr:biotin--[acetyl-CoA-carboxylase] ligase [Candidatus Neomarinimicrobiota bacterium]
MNIRVNDHSLQSISLIMPSHPDLDKTIFLDTVDSTNLELKRRRDEFQDTNVLLVSDAQSQGKGQKGRRWESAAGLGLWMSLYLGRKSSLTHNLQLLSIYTGLVVHEIISPLIKRPVYLKWPNDIMIHSKKCGGILTELQWQGDAIMSAVMGIGINLSHEIEDFTLSIQNQATSLKLEGLDSPDRASLIDAFVYSFLGNLSFLDSSQELATKWNQKAYHMNELVQWESPQGIFEGHFCGINNKGDALVNIDGNLQVFQTGEIRLAEMI